MPGLTPGRRWQPAYLPFHDEPLFDRAVEAVEPLCWLRAP